MPDPIIGCFYATKYSELQGGFIRIPKNKGWRFLSVIIAVTAQRTARTYRCKQVIRDSFRFVIEVRVNRMNLFFDRNLRFPGGTTAKSITPHRWKRGETYFCVRRHRRRTKEMQQAGVFQQPRCPPILKRWVRSCGPLPEKGMNAASNAEKKANATAHVKICSWFSAYFERK